MVDRLDEHGIVAALGTGWLGRVVHYFDEVGSTNTVLAELAEGRAAHGTMVIADYQSQGRGRRERSWDAPPSSSLLVSLLLRPDWPAERASWLTMIAGLALVDALEAHPPVRSRRLSADPGAEAPTSNPVALKWPNDVMIWDNSRADPQWCKAGGLLVETRIDGERLQQAIVGVGLNVNIPRAQLPEAEPPATSLLTVTGRPVARLPLLVDFLQRFEAHYQEAAAGHSPQPAWDALLITRDRSVRVAAVEAGDEGVVEGIALGSDEWGRLLVRTADGEVRRFAAGDVTLK